MRSYGSAHWKFLLRHSYVLYTALFALLYDHNKQQQRNYEGWIPCKIQPSRQNQKEICLRSSWVFLIRNAEGAYRDISRLYDVLMIPGLFIECFGKKGSRKKRIRS